MKSYRAGGIVINNENKIALSNERFWGFPRGGVDKGEDYLTAAKREVLEEVGLDNFTSIHELGVYERYPGHVTKDTPGSYPMEIYMFLFKTDYNGKLTPQDSNVKEANWFTYEEALERLSDDMDREFLKSKGKEVLEVIDEIKGLK
jgi:8-oxo-dGTP pyrophosphatase MutT (NUDIX family)